MDLMLKDKSVLVMASSDGIGKGIAMEFAREGAKVMLFARTEEKLKKVQSEIFKETGRRADFVVGDMLNADDIDKVVKRATEINGPVYALVNNTGGPPAGPFTKFDDEAWIDAFSLTLLSYIRSIRKVLPMMKKQGRGRILNITSSSVKRVLDNLILSNTFRMGIVGLSKTLAVELGTDNILINVLGPGKIQTDRVDYLDEIRAQKAGVPREQYQEYTQKSIPLGRYGTIEEFARLSVFLCSEANTYITGQTILVDGGLVTAY